MSGKQSVSNNRFILKISLFIAGALLFALFLNTALSILTLDKIYSKSLLSTYTVVGDYYVEKIQRSLKFGKSLDNFVGMDKLLATMKEENPDIDQILIYSSEKKYLFSLDRQMPPSAGTILQQDTVSAEKTILTTGNYHLIFPLFSVKQISVDKDLQGYMELVLPESLIQEKLNALILNLGELSLLTGLISTLVLVLAIFAATRQQHEQLLKNRILLITSMVFILSQFAFSYYNVSNFESKYLDDVREKSLKFGKLLQVDIDYFLNLGIPINKLVKIDTLLDDILDNTPELSDITIVDTENKTLYRLESGNTAALATPAALAGANQPYQVSLPLQHQDRVLGAIHLDIAKAAIDKIRFDLVLDLITVAVVSLLIGFEFIFFLIALDVAATRRIAPDAAHTPVRTAAFLYAFAMALSMSFLPLYASQLYTPVPGLPRELAMALPLSAEMLLVALGLVVGGHWLERREWLQPFVIGVVFTGIGVWLCSLAQTTLQLVACRALVGLGYGLVVMSTQTVVINLTTAANRSSAITALEAGYYAGFIASTAIGGMLAEKIGFRGVFTVGALLMLISLLFTFAFLRNIRTTLVVRQSPSVTARKSPANIRLLPLLGDREFVGSLLLSAIPSALCLAGFLYFASPLFLTQAGINQSNIARLMMPYGLCMIYLAPLLSKWADTVNDKRIPVILGGILGGIALVVFYFVHSPLVFVVILILFSISGGMSYGARLAFVSESIRVKRVGVSKALGVFSSLERIGNILGPMLVGSMLVLFSVTATIGVIGLVYLLCNLLLLFFSLPRRHSSPA